LGSTKNKCIAEINSYDLGTNSYFPQLNQILGVYETKKLLTTKKKKEFLSQVGIHNGIAMAQVCLLFSLPI